MWKVLQRFITVSSAFAVLSGCGLASDHAATSSPATAGVRQQELDVDTVPILRQVEPVRFARLLSQPDARADGTRELQIGAASANAARTAHRLKPPVAELEMPATETVQIEDVIILIEQVWLDLAECESNQRWAYNGSSGYDGGLQFSPTTWRAVGGTDFAEYAWQATPFEQVAVAERLLEVQGWGAWPTCSRKLGLR